MYGISWQHTLELAGKEDASRVLLCATYLWKKFVSIPDKPDELRGLSATWLQRHSPVAAPSSADGKVSRENVTGDLGGRAKTGAAVSDGAQSDSEWTDLG